MRLWTEIPGDNAKVKKEHQQIVCVCVRVFVEYAVYVEEGSSPKFKPQSTA